MDLLLTSTSASPAKAPSTWDEGQRASSSSARPTDSWDGGQGASSSSTKPTDSSSTAESGPFDALLGACVQGNAIPVKTVPLGEQPLPMLGGGGPAPHFQEAAIEGTSREIASLPGRQTAVGESWPGLLGADAAGGWKEQASQEVEAGSPRGEGGAEEPEDPPPHLRRDQVGSESPERGHHDVESEAPEAHHRPGQGDAGGQGYEESEDPGSVAPDGPAVSMTAFRNLAFGARTPQNRCL